MGYARDTLSCKEYSLSKINHCKVLTKFNNNSRLIKISQEKDYYGLLHAGRASAGLDVHNYISTKLVSELCFGLQLLSLVQ